MKKLIIEVEDSMKFSTNELWGSWRKAKGYKDDWHYWTEKAIENSSLKKFKGKVILVFSYQWRKNMVDSSNCSVMSKWIEDQMVRCGLFEDDRNGFVVAVINRSENLTLKQRKALPTSWVEITILEEKDKLFKDIFSLTETLWKQQ